MSEILGHGLRGIEKRKKRREWKRDKVALRERKRANEIVERK